MVSYLVCKHFQFNQHHFRFSTFISHDRLKTNFDFRWKFKWSIVNQMESWQKHVFKKPSTNRNVLYSYYYMKWPMPNSNYFKIQKKRDFFQLTKIGLERWKVNLTLPMQFFFAHKKRRKIFLCGEWFANQWKLD